MTGELDAGDDSRPIKTGAGVRPSPEAACEARDKPFRVLHLKESGVQWISDDVESGLVDAMDVLLREEIH
jgi:hypothetical protein